MSAQVRGPRCVSINIQLSPRALPCHSNSVGRSKEDSSPGICFFTARLLQLTVVRCYRHLGSTSSSRLKCVARLVTGIRRCEHITPVLRPLHWLPVRQRNEFKMAVLVYKSLNALSPRYLMDDCQLITTTGRRRLRSSNVATCDVRRTRTSLGDRSFTAAGPRLWNNLPVHLRDSELHRLPKITSHFIIRCNFNVPASKRATFGT